MTAKTITLQNATVGFHEAKRWNKGLMIGIMLYGHVPPPILLANGRMYVIYDDSEEGDAVVK